MVISSLAQPATGHYSATDTRERTIMPNDLTTSSQIPGPDDAAHEDGRLMHDLTVVNTMITRYVLDYADADAGRAEPIPVSEVRPRRASDRRSRRRPGPRKAPRPGRAVMIHEHVLRGHAGHGPISSLPHVGDLVDHLHPARRAPYSPSSSRRGSPISP